MPDKDKYYATGPAHGKYTHGHTSAGQRHRLGYVSDETWQRMVAQCEALQISANELTIRAILAYLEQLEG